MRERTSDSKLVHLARSGDREAFRLLVERYQRPALAVALAILRESEDARDACQEAFLRAYRRLAGFHGDAAFFTWLYRIVVNACLDELRKRRPGRIELDPSLPASEPSPADGAAARELRLHIAAALDRLSVAHRTVLVLREVEELSYEQIARVVGCPKGTVMSRLFHARRRMQEVLSLQRGAASAA